MRRWEESYGEGAGGVGDGQTPGHHQLTPEQPDVDLHQNDITTNVRWKTIGLQFAAIS